MPKYTALTPVRHDGKPYGIGERLTLKTDEAAALLQIRAVEEVDAAAEKAAAEKAAAAQSHAGGEQP